MEAHSTWEDNWKKKFVPDSSVPSHSGQGNPSKSLQADSSITLPTDPIARHVLKQDASSFVRQKAREVRRGERVADL